MSLRLQTIAHSQNFVLISTLMSTKYSNLLIGLLLVNRIPFVSLLFFSLIQFLFGLTPKLFEHFLFYQLFNKNQVQLELISVIRFTWFPHNFGIYFERLSIGLLSENTIFCDVRKSRVTSKKSKNLPPRDTSVNCSGFFY